MRYGFTLSKVKCAYNGKQSNHCKFSRGKCHCLQYSLKVKSEIVLFEHASKRSFRRCVNRNSIFYLFIFLFVVVVKKFKI